MDENSIPGFPGIIGEGNSYSLYSLDEPPYLFVPVCPPGVDCANAPFLLLSCCNTQILVDLIGVVEPERTQKITAALTKCFQLDEGCGTIPTPPITPPGGGGTVPVGPTPITFYWNTAQPCRLSCPDGSVFELTVPGGTVMASSLQKANNLAAAYACTLAKQARICLGDIVASACLGQPFSQTIIVTGAPPVGLSVLSGALPTGLALSFGPGRNSTLSGTPTAAGTFNFTLRGLNPVSGAFHDRAYTMTVMGITDASPLPAGAQGAAYSQQLTGAGGTPPYTFTLLAGLFPAGLSMDDTGLILGTPTETGTFTFTVSIEAQVP